MATRYPIYPARTDDDQPSLPRRVARLLARPVQFVAFWLAVCLPLAYLPLFAAQMLAGQTFVACLVANAVAVVFGHPHRR